MDYIDAKTIVTRTKNAAWFGTDYNMNIYRGCTHGCIYCDSRSACYHVDDYGTVRAKKDALTTVRRDLRSKTQKGVISTGAMSDPYNPYEKALRLTRGALELVGAHRFGLAMTTKSALIMRDVDVLRSIQTHAPVICMLTVTALDDGLCGKIEPDVASSSKRFAAIEKLSSAGIVSGVLLMPVLPFITDTSENILGIVRRAYQCGARFVYPAFGMSLRDTQRDHYYNKLDILFPGLKRRYIRRYGNQYWCLSPRQVSLKKAFDAQCERLGLLYKMDDIVAAYQDGYSNQQLSMLE